MPRIVLALLCATALAAAAAEAHHSHADFELAREVTVTGTIEGIQFRNPHVLLIVRTGGSTFYTAEWEGAGWLQAHPELVSANAAPVTSATLKAGDRIVIVGSPSRDDALRTVVNLKEVRRPSDGWVWSCRQPGMPALC
jgi:ABC-type sugar transport system substrate-binding protein